VKLILDAYPDEGVHRHLALSFTSSWQRALVFHVGQAPMSFRRFRDTGRLLSEYSLTV
jgi:hypothetical protein